jgi:hypothetical protein
LEVQELPKVVMWTTLLGMASFAKVGGWAFFGASQTEEVKQEQEYGKSGGLPCGLWVVDC